MGRPTPQPSFLIGANCDICDDVLWPPGATPLFMPVDVALLEKCPLCPNDPPDGRYFLKQRLGSPHRYDYEDEIFKFDLIFTPVGVNMTIIEFPAAGWFYFEGIAALCTTHFDNIQVACGGLTGSINGTVDLDL